jgi:hypothetical protein
VQHALPVAARLDPHDAVAPARSAREVGAPRGLEGLGHPGGVEGAEAEAARVAREPGGVSLEEADAAVAIAGRRVAAAPRGEGAVVRSQGPRFDRLELAVDPAEPRPQRFATSM